MKALVITLLSPFMAAFALGGLQTIEWCLDSGEAIPWQAYAMLVCAALWCAAAANLSQKDLKKVNKLLERLSGEK